MEEAIQVESIDRLFMCVYVRYTLYNNSIYKRKHRQSMGEQNDKLLTLCASVCDHIIGVYLCDMKGFATIKVQFIVASKLIILFIFLFCIYCLHYFFLSINT